MMLNPKRGASPSPFVPPRRPKDGASPGAFVTPMVLNPAGAASAIPTGNHPPAPGA